MVAADCQPSPDSELCYYSIILAEGHLPGSLDLGQDLLSFSPPHITLGIEIMLGEVLHDSVDQLAHAAEPILLAH